MGHRLNWYLVIKELSPCPKGSHSSGYDLDLYHITDSCQTTDSHDSCSLSGRVVTDTAAKEVTFLEYLTSCSQ
jgi:hypothetical protein